MQIARHLREGRRPEVPPPAALPGQGMATAPGLGAYCQLMRQAGAGGRQGALEGARGSSGDWPLHLRYWLSPLLMKGSRKVLLVPALPPRSECWAQAQEGRPTFADIVPRLRTLLEQA